MFSSFLVTFRETLEAALVVGIILGYIGRTKQTQYNNVVYLGVIFGIVGSAVGAFLFNILAGGFEGAAEQIFEGIVMFLGAILLTTMIMWMANQKHVAEHLEHRIDAELGHSHKFGLFSLVFVSVLREGIETVFFLGAASFVSTDNNIIGALAGIILAMFLGYGVFVGSMKFSLKKFFNITNILLILFVAGLVAHGIHEFQEAGLIPIYVEHVWDINNVLDDHGPIGGVFAGLFGYNGNPSLFEVIGYSLYVVLISIWWFKIDQKKD